MLINGFSSKINASQLKIYIYCGSKQNIVVNAANDNSCDWFQSFQVDGCSSEVKRCKTNSAENQNSEIR